MLLLALKTTYTNREEYTWRTVMLIETRGDGAQVMGTRGDGLVMGLQSNMAVKKRLVLFRVASEEASHSKRGILQHRTRCQKFSVLVTVLTHTS